MPATSLAQLFNFEGLIVPAARAILVAGGFPATHQPGGNAAIKGAFTAVSYAHGEPTGRLGLRPDGTQEFVEFRGILTVDVGMLRKNDEPVDTGGTPLDAECAEIRTLFLNHPQPFAPHLELLQISQIRPLPTDYDLDQTREGDLRALNWELTWQIAPNAWPVD